MSTPKLFRIRVPNPYFEKDNNAYLLDVSELILIDTGIDTPEALSSLRAGVEASDHQLEEISKIFLTHKHLDHFGLAHRIAEVSRAKVYIHQDDHLDVERFDERHDTINNLYEQKMREWGIPQNLIDMLSMRSRLIELGRSVSAISLRDDERISVGVSELRVIHTPGHTQGSACFLLGDLLFAGDHMLPTYTPNIGATEVTSNGMLRKYRASLHKIEELNSIRVLPGHGDEILNPRERIQEILIHHKGREDRILEILSDGRTRSVFEIAQELFGNLREHHVLLGSGEVHAHLEGLLDEKRVHVRDNLYFLVAAKGLH
ncbi:MBL fold metallo-hydrolase [Candidatus Acetothermia bacterium]|nr:MBL fold metallo-hydrolase [Candidatus Acetothermia bacterium]